MNEVLGFLLEVLVSSGIIWCAIMALKTVLRNQLSAKMHLALWIVLIARLTLPVTIDPGIHFMTVPATHRSGTVQMQAQPFCTGQEAVSSTGNGTVSAEADRTAWRPGQATPFGAAAQGAVPVQSPAGGGTNDVSPAELVVCIWILGMLVGAAAARCSYVRLRQRIRSGVIPHADPLQVVFRDSLCESGIREHVELVVQHDAASPALVYPGIIVVPFRMCEMEPEAVRLALRHELMHLKRKDHLRSLGLCTLCIVWWFNPFVWLATKTIREDIEAACDADVIRTLNKDEKRTYAQLLLSMFGHWETSPAMLGMAFAGARRKLERRIRGIFMKQKSSVLGRTAALCLAAVLCVACLTTACQPTPEHEAVVNKLENAPSGVVVGENVSADPAATGAPAAQYIVKERWDEVIEKANGLRIVADADVWVPEVDALPVEQLAPKQITQEMADQMIGFFAPGAVFYRTKQAYTKNDLEQWILEEREALAEAELADNEQRAAAAESMIEYYSSLYETAPNSAADRKPATTEFEAMSETSTGNGEKNYIEISSEAADGTVQEFLVLNGSKDAPWESREFRYTNTYYVLEADDSATEALWQTAALEASELGTQAENTELRQVEELLEEVSRRKPLFAQNSLDQQKAAQQAEELLDRFGISQMQMAACDKALLVPSYHGSLESQPADFIDGTHGGATEPGLYLEYVRENGGIPCLQPDVQLWEPGDGGNVYAAPFSPEKVSIVVDGSYNIRSFLWSSPTEVVKVIEQDSKCISLEEAKERIVDALHQSVLSWEDRTGTNSTMECGVSDIKLVMGYVSAKDAPEDALVVPAWLAHCVARRAANEAENAIEEDIMINALDGARILKGTSL